MARNVVVAGQLGSPPRLPESPTPSYACSRPRPAPRIEVKRCAITE
jgi:hypothetical protein